MEVNSTRDVNGFLVRAEPHHNGIGVRSFKAGGRGAESRPRAAELTPCHMRDHLESLAVHVPASKLTNTLGRIAAGGFEAQGREGAVCAQMKYSVDYLSLRP